MYATYMKIFNKFGIYITGKLGMSWQKGFCEFNKVVYCKLLIIEQQQQPKWGWLCKAYSFGFIFRKTTWKHYCYIIRMLFSHHTCLTVILVDWFTVYALYYQIVNEFALIIFNLIFYLLFLIIINLFEYPTLTWWLENFLAGANF